MNKLKVVVLLVTIKECYCSNTREYTYIPSCWGKLVFDSSRLQEGFFVYTLVKLYNKDKHCHGCEPYPRPRFCCCILYLSQGLKKGPSGNTKSKVSYLQRKKDLAVVNNYRKFEDIIFTNNKDMIA